MHEISNVIQALRGQGQEAPSDNSNGSAGGSRPGSRGRGAKWGRVKFT